MDAKSKSKPTSRRAAITAALEPSLMPPLIGLVCDFTPFGPSERVLTDTDTDADTDPHRLLPSAIRVDA
jgi:hypothetical protein